MSKRIQSTMLAAACGFWLAGTVAFAQTLTVVEPSSHFESAPLTSIRGGTAPVNGPTEIPHHPLPLQANYRNSAGKGADPGGAPDAAAAPDPVLQYSLGPFINATAGANFDGINVYQGGYIPSDSNIAVGPNHIVETVNAAYAIYDKSGTLLLGPNALRSLWTGLGGQCAASNGGDPIVQYDRAADRWIITQLGSLSNPYAECIAVSTSANPGGSYYLWAYSFGSSLNDYPKFGVWPTASNSAYLATYNLFANGATFSSAEICAYDRAAMLSGAANPRALCYTGLSGASFLPSDLDGATPPLDGTPAYFADLNSTSGVLGMYTLSPNFAASSATLGFSTIPVASFTQASSVPQPGTSRALDSLSDRMMYRMAFRMIGSHESIVLTHSVATGGVAGARWYELRGPQSAAASFSLFQQGTFAPGDGIHRWMGSIAMDQAGDIALGYSASSGTRYPSVRYTGRLPGDALGTMAAEQSIKEGAGSQTGYTRWGDYSSMRIDPSDDCTFWYVNEYLPVTSSAGWYTRIGAFKFSGCGTAPAPDFSLSASPPITVTPGASGSSTVTVTPINAFANAVALSATNCPANSTCTFAPNPVAGGSGSSTLTIQTTSNTTTGTTSIGISGTGGGITHTTTLSVTVNPPVTDFTLGLSASTLTVTRKSSGSLTVNLGGTGTVSLSISGLPSKVSASFSPNPATGTSTLTISANPRAATGTYSVTVTGTSAGKTRSANFALTIS